ncbi:MAG: hypothetical protein Q9195_008255 [Heterodermia aff. obscurata]
MLITPYTYRTLQVAEQDARRAGNHRYQPALGWRSSPHDLQRGQEMLLVHQTGSVKIGEVVRYTLTYTPSLDRILPSPSQLHVRIKNTSAIALRAAYLHGPYTLYAATYPSTFNPNSKHDTSHDDGVPDFEPNLKAGGSWIGHLKVPDKIRETAGKANVKRTTAGDVPSCTWIIEVSSQVIFSTTAAVHFEILVGRDEKSIELGFSALTGHGVPTPGQLQDHQQGRKNKDRRNAQPKGVFSKAVHLVVDDTASLWNKPTLPEWDDEGKNRGEKRGAMGEDLSGVSLSRRETGETGRDSMPAREGSEPKKRKVHLVVLTHGLHSNLGADMLYLKESIDAAAKEAREDTRKRKKNRRGSSSNVAHSERVDTQERPASIRDHETSTAPLSGGQDDLEPDDEVDSEDEEVIVRGFSGNAVRTEKGIQYLGKRLAKYVLQMTYPDQPFLPVKKSMTRTLSRAFTGSEGSDNPVGSPSHKDSSIHHGTKRPDHLAYKITSISFIAHSLGGLTQTYAIAYIHKHSPHFFTEIKPINFVTMASPFLGLSNENPMYVRFALDFGLVGRTGQDLGLTWRAPTMVRSGWGAMIGGIGSEGQRAQKQPDPGAKPLLRVLPTGPAHQVLKLFRNRTVYSNVVNDGIVPLRTSCLLFLDWSGLGRVEKARRENGLIGTMAGWGWAEMTGTNSSQRRQQGIDCGATSGAESGEERSRSNSRDRRHQATVPQPAEDATKDDITVEDAESPGASQFIDGRQARPFQGEQCDPSKAKETSPAQPQHPLASFLNFLRPNQNKSPRQSPKSTRIYKRGQTIKGDFSDGASSDTSPPPSRPGMARGTSLLEDPNNSFAPPKTSIFESAGDILNPPLPTPEFILDPSSRPRTIFHDRVYHPEDIPPPPPKSRMSLKRSFSSDASRKAPPTDQHQPPSSPLPPDPSSMKIEEKIARAYHRDLSWRKVLVRLEPDAHNNICVRRMFANAYGWPVVKHLVDTHFSAGFEARTADAREPNRERAKEVGEPVGEQGGEIRKGALARTESEIKEAEDDVSELRSKGSGLSGSSGGRRGGNLSRQDSVLWDDAMFEVTDDDEDEEDEVDTMHHANEQGERRGTTNAEIADFLSSEPSSTLPMRPDPIPTSSSNPEVAITPATPRKLPPSSPSSPPRSTASAVGLGKSVEEQMGM